MRKLRKTNLLILTCIIVSLLLWYRYTPFMGEYLVYSGDKLTQGFLWTPITTLFIHAGWEHLIGNMIFLYVFGNAIEKETGGKKTMLAFFAGGIGSVLVSSFYYGFDVSMVGASGAIFTLTAATMLTKPLKLSFFFLFIPLGLVAILYFIFNVFAVVLDFGGSVGYAAHVAGFLIGVPFGIAFSKGEWVKNVGITILLLIGFLMLIFLLQVFLNLF